MRTVEDAFHAIQEKVIPLPPAPVSLLSCLGSVLAEDIQSDSDVPPFSNSAVDGYAVRAVDTTGARADAPVFLRARGEIPAGATRIEGLLPGEAARIMTGAPVPEGADAVVMLEDTWENEQNRIAIQVEAVSGQHVRRQGEDLLQGAIVLSAGTRVRATEIALMAAVGRTQVMAIRPPRIAVLTTGDEVIEVKEGSLPPFGKIRNSNRFALHALALEAGGQVVFATHAMDDLKMTEQALRDCLEAGVDVIVSAGGVSVGDRDFVKPALEKLGSLALWKVAMKPGKPLAFGTIGSVLFFGLPGNPVSAMVTFELFVRPVLGRLAGRTWKAMERRQETARCEVDLSHTPGRREYVRAITRQADGVFWTHPVGAQGSGILSSLAYANSFMIVPEEAEHIQRGESIAVMLLE